MTTFPGLTVRSFYNHPTVQQLQCTVASLTTEIDVVGIKLFAASDRQTLAYINFRTHECSTSSLYAACVKDEKDVKRTKLVVLLVEWLYARDVWEFGCNVTGFKPGLELYTASWMLSVHKREYYSLTAQAVVLDLFANCETDPA
jgi:hypothetical protein